MGGNKCLVAVHGGAWAIPEHLWSDSIKGVKEAALIGYKVLKKNGSALDTVQKAVMNLEDNTAFDAGTGSVLTYDEEVEMDALIMEGRTMRSGAVAAIQNIRNPIAVARLVLEKTQHVLLVGKGANKFSKSLGIEEVSPHHLVTSEARDELEKYKKFETTVESLFNNDKIPVSGGHDTVGCVALDHGDSLACGTSTGGITAKMPGRVGDSPIIGCGGIADDEVGAISTTGHGEAIMKCCLAKSILVNLSQGETSTDAIKNSLNYMERRLGGFGGAICVDKKGDVGVNFTTERMAWAYVANDQLHYGLHRGQHQIENIIL